MIYDLQKASLMKRFSAFLLDFILAVVILTGALFLIMSVAGYNDYYNEFKTLISDCEEEFGISFDITNEDYEKMTEDERTYFDACYDKVVKNERYMYLTNMIFNITILAISASLFASLFVVEFLIPLFLKNGQTLGKKVFGIAVMRIDGVRVTPVIMFVRSMLGKYTIEIMIPVILFIIHMFGMGSIVTVAVFFLLILFNIILLIATHTNSFIHDVLASTVTVDLQSQMIFNSLEELNDYKLRIHSEDVKKSQYF